LLVADPARRSEGISLLRDSVALRERFLGSEDARTREARALLVNVETH
jgi:hypothetical protein